MLLSTAIRSVHGVRAKATWMMLKKHLANYRLEHNGTYLEDSHIANPWTETMRPWATSKIEAERPWKLSEKLVGQEFA